jgi:hypothetical protein
MTAGSIGSAQTDATGTTPSGSPRLDVVEQALQMMLGGAVHESAAEVGAATQAELEAVDILVVDALTACQTEAPDTMASLITTIAERHRRDGVSRAVNLLGAVGEHMGVRPGQPGEDIELTAPVRAARTAEQRLVLVRSARLASEFLTAIVNHDGLRLATTLKDMRTENFAPVLAILVSHAAGLLDATGDVRMQVEAALGRQLCPTQA